jgi:hypothetical protein
MTIIIVPTYRSHYSRDSKPNNFVITYLCLGLTVSSMLPDATFRIYPPHEKINTTAYFSQVTTQGLKIPSQKFRNCDLIN